MRVVPARNGWSWLVRGFALFRKSPPMWLFLVFTYWIAVALLGQIRYLGPATSTVLLPAFSVSFMIMCAVLERGGLLRGTASAQLNRSSTAFSPYCGIGGRFSSMGPYSRWRGRSSW